MIKGETGAALSDQEILDEVWTLISAGNDTTATALAWRFTVPSRSKETVGKPIHLLLTNSSSRVSSSANDRSPWSRTVADGDVASQAS
jgi:hypothetical protein